MHIIPVRAAKPLRNLAYLCEVHGSGLRIAGVWVRCSSENFAQIEVTHQQSCLHLGIGGMIRNQALMNLDRRSQGVEGGREWTSYTQRVPEAAVRLTRKAVPKIRRALTQSPPTRPEKWGVIHARDR